MSHCLTWRLTVLLVLGLFLSFPVSVAGDMKNVPIERLVENLDATRYETRTEATEALIARGVKVIPALEAGFERGSLELRMRVIYILKEIALSAPGQIDASAQAALQRLAAGPTSSANRAREVLQRLADSSEQRALARRIALGARFERLTSPVFVQDRALVIDSEAWKGTDADMVLLAQLRAVRALQLSGDAVRNNWFTSVARMPNLSHLVIKRASHVTNAALEPLRQLRSLQRLDVFYSPIDDGALAAMAAMKNRLQYIRLYGTQVTLDGAQKLEAMLPPTAVLDYKRGAFLGVQCRAEWLCQVSEVTEGSAAQRAGIRSGDILIRFGGRAIRSFEDLRKAIAGNAPGDREKLTLLRGATEVTFYLGRGTYDAKDVGAETKPHSLGLLVTEVKKGSVADQAGLRKGDLLFSVEGVTPTSLEHLLATIRKIDKDRAVGGGPLTPRGGFPRPGNPPPSISGLRGFQQLELEVVFGEWQ